MRGRAGDGERVREGMRECVLMGEGEGEKVCVLLREGGRREEGNERESVY